MKTYLETSETVLTELVSKKDGLEQSEAARRLEKNGKNKLKEAEKDSIMIRILNQIKDPMILVLLAAAMISGITAVYAGESFADVIIILSVVIINSILGVYQESKAEKAIEALQAISAVTSRVYRDGKISEIKSDNLVIGDVIVLEAGDSVPADARIIESASLKIEEAALTGESVPVEKESGKIDLFDQKDIPLGDRKNMVYRGSTVAYGRGRAVIIATGMATEMGKIADAITQTKESETPLQIKLNELSKILSWLVLGICIFIFALSLLRLYLGAGITGMGVLNTFMVAVSLAVAAIPEGLAAVVTIVLSIGVTNMSRKKAVIRKLTAVETLGCTQVICSDKTGTLTQNKMTVVEHFGFDAHLLGRAMTLCNDAYINPESNLAEGEPTEAALLNYGISLGLKTKEIEMDFPRIGEVPFDSGRKLMTTVHQCEDNTYIQYTKGAPDILLSRCTSYWNGTETLPLTEAIREEMNQANKKLANNALRVLAGAQKEWQLLPKQMTSDVLEAELCFLGLSGMIDPIRTEAKVAIEQCKSAGIKTVMITGDHRDTAIAIAKQLSIISSDQEAITGAELDELSDEQLNSEIKNYSVYARVQPEHKVRIVKAWKKLGKIVAMTGDGVNDAPSIKAADIGIGMGITGTDVTKSVAHMVLSDDNFATIVKAVEEGRRIYENIRKTIQFLLSSNLSEVLSILIATLLGFTILRPVHLLWINLITDSFPAIALGMEGEEANIMESPPRESTDGIFSQRLGFDVVWQGILVTAVTVLAYFVGHFMEFGVWQIADSAEGMTMAFLTLSMAEMFHSLNMRSRRQSIFKMKTKNPYLVLAIFASLIMTSAVIFVPSFAAAFDFTPISLYEYFVAMGLAVVVIPVVEIVKLFQRKQKAGSIPLVNDILAKLSHSFEDVEWIQLVKC